MAAVECLVLAEDESPRAGKMVIGETNLECPTCHKGEYVRKWQGQVQIRREAAVPVQGMRPTVPKM